MVNCSQYSVLVVDDSPNVLKILTTMLKGAGMGRVIPASGAAQAFDILQSEPVDFVITDYLMQPQTGLDLTRRIRSESGPSRRDLPVLLLSGFETEAVEHEAMSAGVTCVCQKPISAGTLLGQIRTILDLCGQPASDRHTEGGSGHA